MFKNAVLEEPIWTLTDAKFWSLGIFHQGFDYSADYEIDELAYNLGNWVEHRIAPYAPNFHIRSPHHKWALATRGQTMDWHQDGTKGYLLLWSNTLGTEIIRKQDKGKTDPVIYQPAPSEVVIIDNEAFYHRTPRYYRKAAVANRWFVRAPICHPEMTFLRDNYGIVEYVT